MVNKTRFQSTKTSQSKGLGSGSGSKKVIGGAVSGFPISTKGGGGIQVIFNGKIVTPQSLLPKKIIHAEVAHTSKRLGHGTGLAGTTGLGGTGVGTEDMIEKSSSGGGLYVPPPLKKGASQSAMGGRRGSASGLLPSGTTLEHHESSQSRVRNSALNVNALAQKKVVEEQVTVLLEETSTEIVFALPSLIMSTEVREVVQLEEKNARYENLIETHKHSDNFSSRPTQTLNNPQKNQNEMVAPNASQDMGCQAYAFDIYDTIEGNVTKSDNEKNFGTEDLEESGLTSYVQKYVSDTVNMTLSAPGCVVDVTSTTTNPNTTVVKSGHGVGNKVTSKNVSTTNRPTSNSNYNLNESRPSDSDPEAVSGTHSEGGDTFQIITTEEYDSQKALLEKEIETIMTSTDLLKRLQMVERAIQQNAYHKQILEYRDFPDIKPLILQNTTEKVAVVDSVDQLFGVGLLGRPSPGNQFVSESSHHSDLSKKLGGALGQENSALSGIPGAGGSPEELSKVKKLFTFSAPNLVRGRPVTAMSWNSENKDLLAVGYGKVDFLAQQLLPPQEGTKETEENLASGLVLFWSLRNPDYPEKVLKTPHAVTALDFSHKNPSILAVGLYNGDIAIYNVRKEEGWDKPVETSAGMSGGHSDPVWQVRWVSKNQDRVENLVSISTDGNVLQWSLKKGLLVSLLMQLKRGGNTTGAGEGWISRQASGLCFDFCPEDVGTYVTGTEEGNLHKCSVSYNEQYLESYEPHNGPVYRIKFSPWWSDVFLSCSADWTVSLYHLRLNSPVLTFHSSGEDVAINDLAWCPMNSTVFGTVTDDAKFQLWDLSVSDIDPIISLDTNLDVPSLLPGSLDHHDLQEKDGSVDKDPHHSTSIKKVGGNSLLRREPGAKEKIEEDHSNPVSRLLKTLATSPLTTKRRLTSLSFSEDSPVAVVGDNHGILTVYRVNEPSLMKDISNPAIQSRSLMDAVYKNADPADVTKLQQAAAQQLSQQAQQAQGQQGQGQGQGTQQQHQQENGSIADSQ